MSGICRLTWTVERIAQTEELLHRLARQQWPVDTRGLQRDLVQAAWLRLLRERFDPQRGVPFERWLVPRARWAMADAQRAEGWVRPHRGDREEPVTCSLDAPAPSGDPVSEVFAAPSPKYHDPFLAARIRDAFGELPPRLRSVLLARAMGVTQKSLTRPLGVNESRVSQLSRKALRLFRDSLHRRGVL